MTSILRAPATRLALATALSAGNIVAMISAAHAVSLRVQMACASDYYVYCSQHPTEGPKCASACERMAPSSRRAA